MPIGGTEQNGPHMALGKHNVRVEVLSEKIAARARQRAGGAGDRLCAGGRRRAADGAYASFPARSPFAGRAFEKMLEYAARSFKLAGFRDIVFLGDHGGYQKDDQAVADRLDREWAATPVRVHAVTEYYRATRDRVRAGC